MTIITDNNNEVVFPANIDNKYRCSGFDLSFSDFMFGEHKVRLMSTI